MAASLYIISLSFGFLSDLMCEFLERQLTAVQEMP